MAGKRARRIQGAEAGLTLVELLISAMLLVLVVSVAGGLLNSTLSTSNFVGSAATAVSAGQVSAQSVVSGIRNSSDFRLTSPTGADQLLVARTAGGASAISWVCSAWYFSASSAMLRHTTSTTAISSAPTQADLATWTVLDQNVTPSSGTGIFSAAGEQLSVSFRVSTGAKDMGIIQSTALSRAGATGDPVCY